ncbi:DUF3516 domain-containing protein [Canibacter zhuwentaonis]|uniref:DUF3516 domain-containing protein n=1 Tax=Canibacter zhuwentaonis TaxID=2837491 RepID=UPI002028835E|nr:DUF3516 domain-containing protein [Canibacter zhuwentaonis]
MSHESTPRKYTLMRQSLDIIRSLKNAGVITVVETDTGKLLRFNESVNTNITLTSPLSLFGIAALELLDPATASFTLDIVSVVEATLENPRAVLIAQQQKLRRELVAQLKADGAAYDTIQNELEQVEHPQPLRELLVEAFERYATHTPAARASEIAPKSVLRDMLENLFGFREFINHYSLTRAEGVLLRYLTDVYRVLVRTVPEKHKTAELVDVINWLGEMIRQVDSSLLDEWARLSSTAAAQESASATCNESDLLPPGAAASGLLTDNRTAFERMLRNKLFQLVTAAALDNVKQLSDLSKPDITAELSHPLPQSMNQHDWDRALDAYYSEYDYIETGASARNSAMCVIDKESTQTWQIEQIILDPERDNAWAIYASCDLALSNQLGEPAITVHDFRAR